MTARIEKLLFGLLLVAVIFSALAQGVVEPWSIAIFEALGVLTILAFASRLVAQRRVRVELPALLWPVVAFLLLGLLHCMAFGGGDGEVRSLSRDVEATRK